MSLSPSCSGPHRWKGTAGWSPRNEYRQRVEGDRDGETESASARYRDKTGERDTETEQERQIVRALTPDPAPAVPDCALPTSSPAVPGTLPSPPLASPQWMGHGEAPLQADALVHQELPEEAGGAARGVPGRARPGGRSGRGGDLHRYDRVEAGLNAGCAGPFLGSRGGGAGGRGQRAHPPRLTAGPLRDSPTGTNRETETRSWAPLCSPSLRGALRGPEL